jgi:hypothetical protein
MSGGLLYSPDTGVSDAWSAGQPKLADYGNDVAKWLAAMKDYAATQNGGPAFPAQPTDAQMSAAYGPGWHAAGAGITPPSAGEYYAGLLNSEYINQNQEGVKGPSFEMQLQAREAARPGEMQAAYNAVNPKTGEPLLLPQIGGYLEQVDHLTPPGGTPPDQAPGGTPAVNPAGGTFYDPQTGQLVSSTINPQPDSGLFEVPNNFDPNDPNAPRIAQAMGYIALFAKQGSLYGSDQSNNWQMLNDILVPLGIDPATFVAGVLNYNNYQVNEDGTVVLGTAPFAGYTPPDGGSTTPPAGNAALSPVAGGGTGLLPNTTSPPQPGVAGGGTGLLPNGAPAPQPGVAGGGGGLLPGASNSLVNQNPSPQANDINLGQFDPYAMGQSPSAMDLHQQYGSAATLDPRYPDWMLSHQPPIRRRLPAF